MARVVSLAYAERHPGRVSRLVLINVMTCRGAEIDWLYHGAGRMFPGEWRRFRDAVPPDERSGDLPAAYDRMFDSPGPGVRARAASESARWEDAVLSLEDGGEPNSWSSRPSDAQLAMTRICARYFSRVAWREEGQLLRDIHRLTGIPGVLIHGRRDLSCPLETAWELAQAWPAARLEAIDDAGHRGSRTMSEALVRALNEEPG